MFGRFNQVMQLKPSGINRSKSPARRAQLPPPQLLNNYGPVNILPTGSTVMSLSNDGTLSVNKLKLGGNTIYLGKDGEIYVNDKKFLPEPEAPKEEPEALKEPEPEAPKEPEPEAPKEPEPEAPKEPEAEAPKEPEAEAPKEPEAEAPKEEPEPEA